MYKYFHVIMQDYTRRLYGLGKHDRIFPCTRDFFRYHMRIGTKDGDVKKIRIHDLRHPYVKATLKIFFKAKGL